MKKSKLIQGFICNISIVYSLKLLNEIINSEISIVVLSGYCIPLNISYFLVINLDQSLSCCVFSLTHIISIPWSFLISICWSSSNRFWTFLIFIQYTTVQLYFWLIRNTTFILDLYSEFRQCRFLQSLWKYVINSWDFIYLLSPFILFWF